jgi:glycosyltransferase involved in cell wall biosynthesis
MHKLPISVIILTKDEELNLPHALQSVAHWVQKIFVVDSHSTDRTRAIAEEFGAEIVTHDFINQADQFNWALDTLTIDTEWILRLDADEVISESLWEEIAEEIKKVPEQVTGFYLPRRVYFMGRWIKHGGYYPTYILRLFRKGKARSEERAMDEHIILLGGESRECTNDFKDDNHKNLHWWIQKHNNYALREAQAIIGGEGENALSSNLSGSQAERKRWLKLNIYNRLPLFVRPTLYFLYRYFILLGFLDGKEGAIFHFLQGFWYRFLVDAKVFEMRRKNEVKK